MLSRPEVNTKEHILLWLASKDAKEEFHWPNSRTCACAQYEAEHGLSYSWIGPLAELNDIGEVLHYHKDKKERLRCLLNGGDPCSLYEFPGTNLTFGELYKAAREHWDGTKRLWLKRKSLYSRSCPSRSEAVAV